MSPSCPSSPSNPTSQTEHFEDFTKHEWCTKLLSDPSITRISKRQMPKSHDVSNSFFAQTLFTDDALRAFLSMYRPGKGGRQQSIAEAEISSDALLGDAQGRRDNRAEDEKGLQTRVADEDQGKPKKVEKLYNHDDPDEPEALVLASLGKGVDGGIDRLHGGVIATLLDQVMGMLISYAHESSSATAELNIKYKKAVDTPCVVLCRAKIVREAGRWIETVGWVEDGKGTVFAEGRAAFVKNKVGSGASGAAKI